MSKSHGYLVTTSIRQNDDSAYYGRGQYEAIVCRACFNKLQRMDDELSIVESIGRGVLCLTCYEWTGGRILGTIAGTRRHRQYVKEQQRAERIEQLIAAESDVY